MVYKLNNNGINTIRDLAEAEPGFIVQIPGIGPKTAEKLITMAKEYFKNRSAAQQVLAPAPSHAMAEKPESDDSATE